MSVIDFAAAQAVARAKLLERAVHDSGPWAIEILGLKTDAVRVLTPTRVVFLAWFPDICWTEPPEVAYLYCAGELVASQPVVAPDEGAHSIQWSIGFPRDELARV